MVVVMTKEERIATEQQMAKFVDILLTDYVPKLTDNQINLTKARLEWSGNMMQNIELFEIQEMSKKFKIGYDAERNDISYEDQDDDYIDDKPDFEWFYGDKKLMNVYVPEGYDDGDGYEEEQFLVRLKKGEVPFEDIVSAFEDACYFDNADASWPAIRWQDYVNDNGIVDEDDL
jgi:hypothetical protein